jgi:LPS-assembly protein
MCLLAAVPLAAQVPPPQLPTLSAPPPPPPEAPNAANPDQRLKYVRPGAPNPEDYDIEADSQEADGDLRHLRGHVHMESVDKRFDADMVDYNDDTGDVEAWGNIRYENFLDGTKLSCDHLTYNVNTESGIFYNVKGTSEPTIISRPGLLTTNNPFYFEGVWGERRDGKYVMHDGFITDCKVPKPWWRLTSTKFDITPGDKAITYRAVFHVRKVPIFYFPVYYKSLKKLPRQSGFLTPNVGHSSTFGEMFGLAFYWAINRSYDMLTRVQYFTSRGPAETSEFRGRPWRGTDFSLDIFAVQDRGINIGNAVNGSCPTGTFLVGAACNQNQGGQEITFDGHSDLGDGWQARVHVDELSSFLFREAFSQSFHDTIFSETHSVGYVMKHWSSFTFDVAATRDEEYEDANSPKDTIVIDKLPAAEFLSRDRQILAGPAPVWFSFNGSAGFFNRTQTEFQTPTFVDRLDVNPELTTAFHFAGFNLSASFGVQETEYGASFVNGLVSDHSLLRSDREVRIDLIPPSLEKIYQSPKWLGGVKVKHVIEPRVEYHFVDGIDDFTRIIRFDEDDLMSDSDTLTLSLANRFFVKDKDGNVSEVFSVEVAQSRYFNPTFGGAVIPGQYNVVQDSEELDGFTFLNGPRAYSPIVSALRFQHVVGFEWRVDYDPLLGRITNTTFNGNVRLANKYLFGVGHSEINNFPDVVPPSDQINVLFAIGNQTRKGWNAAVNAFYDLHYHVLEFGTTEVTYNTDCCGISAEYRRYNFGIRDDTQYRVSFTIANIGSFGNMRKQERIY